MAWARRKDGNHNEVRDAFLRLGWTISETYRAPGCPDFFAAKAGRTIAVEVKAPKKGKRSDEQKLFGDLWPGEYALITDVAQVAQVEERG